MSGKHLAPGAISYLANHIQHMEEDRYVYTDEGIRVVETVNMVGGKYALYEGRDLIMLTNKVPVAVSFMVSEILRIQDYI